MTTRVFQVVMDEEENNPLTAKELAELVHEFINVRRVRVVEMSNDDGRCEVGEPVEMEE
jgi:hypothetical protein